MSASDARNERAFQAVEDVLRQLHPREDARAQTDVLRRHFVTAGPLFRAGEHTLETLGLRPADALLLSRLTELTRCMRRASFGSRARLDCLIHASEYLAANFHGLQVERFYMFCLDARGRLKRAVLLQEGTSDGALFSLKAMLAEVVSAAPNAVLISHNHPGCTLRPSQDDIRCTLEAIRALTAVGVPLLDHVIVAGSRAVSMRDNGFIPAERWLAQYPNHRLLTRWLDSPPPDPD